MRIDRALGIAIVFLSAVPLVRLAVPGDTVEEPWELVSARESLTHLYEIAEDMAPNDVFAGRLHVEIVNTQTDIRVMEAQLAARP